MPVVLEALHYAAAIPLIALVLFWRDAPAQWWVVAFAFAVSWFADYLAGMMGGSFLVTHYYPAIQFGAFAFAFGVSLGPSLMIALSIMLPVTSGPEIAVTAVGSVLVLSFAKGKLAPSIWAYCFFGTLFYLMLATEVATGQFMVFWWPYQACRVAAFGLFLGAAHGERQRLRAGPQVVSDVGRLTLRHSFRSTGPDGDRRGGDKERPLHVGSG